MNLDGELRRALRRKLGPSDLADRVLAGLERSDRSVRREHHRPRRIGVLAAAAAAALMIAGSTQYVRQRHLTALEAERVNQDVRLALQIAGEKLALVQRKLHRPGEETR